ncbi:MAG: hypothetical protein HWE16_18910 [Gammaproteobacteria bacterium]|nr:hypothetical protein [Gammaproteobacteria bacterium]
MAIASCLSLGALADAENANLAKETLNSDGIQLELIEFSKFSLTVKGSNNVAYRKVFNGESSVFINKFDADGFTLPDGNYRYEVRQLKNMVGSDGLDLDSNNKMGGAQNKVQAGQFVIKNGSFKDINFEVESLPSLPIQGGIQDEK